MVNSMSFLMPVIVERHQEVTMTMSVEREKALHVPEKTTHPTEPKKLMTISQW